MEQSDPEVQELQSKYIAFKQGKSELEAINNSIKQKKTNLEAFEKDVIKVLVHRFNKAWIDESGTGAGPYILVDQISSEPALKDNDLLRLFHSFIESVMRNEQITPASMLAKYKEEKKKGEKRSLKLVTRVRRPEGDGSATELLKWQKYQ